MEVNQFIFKKMHVMHVISDHFGGVEPTSGPQITIISFCDPQISYQGQNMVSI